jgi:predicted MFS family arabinose efflux permease
MRLPPRLAVHARAIRAATANAGLRRVQVARLTSVTGRWAYTVTLAVFAYRTGGAGGVAVAGIVRLGPATLVAPFTGALAARFRVERLLLVGGLARTAALAAAAGLIFAGRPAWQVYLCVAAESACSTALRPLQNSLLPGLAQTPEELISATLALSVIESVGVLVGPLLAAVLLQYASIGAVFAAAAASYFVSLIVLLPVRVERDEPTGARLRSEGLFDSALAGLRVVAADRESGTVLLLYGAQNFVAGALNVLIVVTALHLLGLGQSSVGALTAAIGVGGVVGGGLVLARVRRERHGSDLALGLVLWGVPLVALALAQSETAAFLLLIVVGIGVTVVDVSAVTLLQRAAQGELLAHALGLLQAIFVATVALGTLTAPLLVSEVGARKALLLTGIPLPLLAAALWRHLKRLDSGERPASPWAQLLAETTIFAPLSSSTREQIARSLRERALPPRTVVFSQGDRGDAFYLVERGEVDVEVADRQVRTLGAGDYFGEIALLRDVPRTATIRTVGEVKLLALDRESFLATVANNRGSADAADAVVGARLGFAGALGPFGR